MLKFKVELKIFTTNSDATHNNPVISTTYISQDSQGNPRYFKCATSALMVALGRAFKDNLFSPTKLIGEIVFFDKDDFIAWLKEKGDVENAGV